ncbi:MAG: hypothetical protein ACREN4_03640 [Candidatus Dormibacteria bacterium]
MKRVGFFSDLPHGDASSPAIASMTGKLDQETARRLSRFMASGSVIMPFHSERCYDILSSRQEDLGPLMVQSDGEWAWPSDIAYFVEKYQVGMPSEFIEHAERSGWSARELDDQAVESAGHEFARKSESAEAV